MLPSPACRCQRVRNRHEPIAQPGTHKITDSVVSQSPFAASHTHASVVAPAVQDPVAARTPAIISGFGHLQADSQLGNEGGRLHARPQPRFRVKGSPSDVAAVFKLGSEAGGVQKLRHVALLALKSSKRSNPTAHGVLEQVESPDHMVRGLNGLL